MSRQAVLALLREREGDFVSGGEIGRRLGLSRAAVWKAVEGLRQDGYTVEARTGLGYRLEAAPDAMTEPEIRRFLEQTAVVGRRLICLESVDSTNLYARQLAMAGAADGTVVTADRQTAGRGRLGRDFQSPGGLGIYLTALLRPDCPLEQVSALTAWTAVAVCDAVEELCGIRPGIKWPNDVILDGRKLCGILTELELEAETAALRYVVVGLGLNVSQTEADFGPEVAPVAVSLAQALGRAPRRAEAAGAVIAALDRMAADFPRRWGEWLERYRADCLTLGRPVRLLRAGGEEEAFAEAVGEDFALVVRFPDGRREAVSSGEVSVRGLLGYL